MCLVLTPRVAREEILLQLIRIIDEACYGPAGLLAPGQEHGSQAGWMVEHCCQEIQAWIMIHHQGRAGFCLIEFYFSTYVFTLIYKKYVPKMVLFLAYQGVWGLQHTFISALQPLEFKHFIGIRCYVTNVAYCYA